MKDASAKPHPPGVPPAAIFIFVFVTVVFVVGMVATAVTFILPQSFGCTARISAKPGPVSGPVQPASGADFILATCQIIQSPAVLTPVVEQLDLNDVWGRKYFNGQTLKTSESLEMLKPRIQLNPVPNTTFIAITAYSDDKLEAAEIANAIAGSYRDYRQQTYKGSQSPSSPPVLVQIIDSASPGVIVVKPNKPLNIALGGVIGAVIGLPLAGIAAFIAARNRKRRLHQNSTI